jgi:hypothetical protein
MGSWFLLLALLPDGLTAICVTRIVQILFLFWNIAGCKPKIAEWLSDVASTLLEKTRGAWAKEVNKTQKDSAGNTQQRYLILFADFQTGSDGFSGFRSYAIGKETDV